MRWPFFVLLISCSFANAQILQVTPEFPSTDDTVTIIYNAQLGNGDLAGYNGDVFAHTGVITSESQSSSDWKHVVDNWGTFDSATLMESLGNDLYRIRYHIRSFYGIQPGEKVYSLAFVFRNENASLVGREADGSDIFYTINQQTLHNFQSYTLNQNVLTVYADSGAIQIQPYDENIFKVTLVNDVASNPDSSFSVVMQPQSTSAIVDDQPDYLEYSLGDLKLHLSKYPVRLYYVFNGDTLLRDEAGLYNFFGTGGVQFHLQPEEHIYGTGSRAIDVDRRGKKLTSYNTAQYGYGNGASVLNINIPFIVSTNGYGLFMDNYSPGTWDIGYSDSAAFAYTSESGKFSYFFIAGNSNEEILDQYTTLTGKQPLPPRWALGYIQSKFGYQNEDEARNIVTLMRNAGFPLDALVLDLYWYGNPSMMGNLNWDFTRFPTPVDMMHDFDSLGIKTILITEPYITQNSSNFSVASTNNLLATDTFGNDFIIGDFWAGSAGLLDMFSSPSQDWMWSFYNDRINEGAGGWWSDLGEPENHPWNLEHSIGMARTVHNVYSLIWSQMLFEKYQQNFPQTRLFNLIRSGYAGMQRYSAFPWSGDIQRSFDGLKAQIPIMLGMGMSGVGYMHSDIGGFTGGGQNEELYTRWQEYGSFVPVMRAHGEGVATEPVYYSATAQNTIRTYSQLRHQLTPYNYSLAYENSTHGTPLARPLNFYESQNQSLSNINDEYLWGKNFLVAPVITQGATSRSVLFPEGIWINYWNNTQTFQGGSSYSVSAPLNTLPLFVKAGSLIPFVPLTNTLAAYNTDTLIIKFYPDLSVQQSSFDLYDDDGADPAALDELHYDLINFTAFTDWHVITIALSKTGNSYAGAPAVRQMNFQLQRILSSPTSVLLNGIDLPFTANMNDFNAEDSAYFYEASTHILYAHFKWNGSNSLLQINDGFLSGIASQTDQLPSLLSPYPNPFSNTVMIRCNKLAEGKCSLEICNLQGQLVRSYDLKEEKIGSINVEWDGQDQSGNILPAGVYMATFKSGVTSQSALVVKE